MPRLDFLSRGTIPDVLQCGGGRTWRRGKNPAHLGPTERANSRWTLEGFGCPALPLEEQIENSSVYFEPSNGFWFLFTNHVGIDTRGEYTDAIWVYWSKDPLKWNPAHKAVVLDGSNCTWSKVSIGMPSVVKVEDKLAMFYDAPGGDSIGHMRRHIGLAWLDLPLAPPDWTSSEVE